MVTPLCGALITTGPGLLHPRSRGTGRYARRWGQLGVARGRGGAALDTGPFLGGVTQERLQTFRGFRGMPESATPEVSLEKRVFPRFSDPFSSRMHRISMFRNSSKLFVYERNICKHFNYHIKIRHLESDWRNLYFFPFFVDFCFDCFGFQYFYI